METFLIPYLPCNGQGIVGLLLMSVLPLDTGIQGSDTEQLSNQKVPEAC